MKITGWMICMLGIIAWHRMSFAQAPPQQSVSAAPTADLFLESEEIKTASELWEESGFRLSLHGFYGRLISLDDRLDAILKGIEISAGARLEPQWSAIGRLQYALTSGGISGLHFNASIEPTLHVSSWLSIGVSLGLAGIIEFEDIRPDTQAELNGQLIAAYDHPLTDPTLARCEGFGASEALRVNFSLIIGPLSALTAGLYLSHQNVTCIQSTNRIEPDYATPIERRQRWTHLSWGITTGVTWR